MLYQFKRLKRQTFREVGHGHLGAPDTSVLFGGREDGDVRASARFTIGYQREAETDGFVYYRGFEANFLDVSRHSNTFEEFSFGSPVLARPFFDAITGASRIEQVANFRIGTAGTIPPDIRAVEGGVGVANPSRLWGAEINGTIAWDSVIGGRVTLFGGLRHLQFSEGLAIREDLLQPADPTGALVQTQFLVNDSFFTRNQFWGGQVGAKGEWRYGSFTFEALGKLAVGATHELVDITGFTVVSPTGAASTTSSGGLLALTTNIGSYSRDHFAVVPEMDLTVGYMVTPGVKAFIGYTLITWSDIVRPGDQIDLFVNPSFVPGNGPPAGVARPAFNFHATELWVQGIHAGVEVRF